MKKKITITILVGLGLFFGFFVLGAENFGFETIGNPFQIADDEQVGIKATLNSPTGYGEISQINVWLASTTDGDKHYSAIFDKNGDWIASTIERDDIDTDVEGSWVNFDFSENPILPNDEYLLIHSGDAEFKMAKTWELEGKEEVVCDSEYGVNTCYEEWEFNVDDSQFSIYAVYETWTTPIPVSPFVETDENFVAGIISYVRAWIGSGIFPLLAMFIGIPFAFVVIRRVITLVPKK